MRTVIFHDKAEHELTALLLPTQVTLMRQFTRWETTSGQLAGLQVLPLRDGLFDIKVIDYPKTRRVLVYPTQTHIFLLRIFITATPNVHRLEVTRAHQRLKDMKPPCRTLEQVHATALQNPAYQQAYEAAALIEEYQAVLARWRTEAGITSAHVAARMGTTTSTIARMEKNPTRMSDKVLQHYALVCGVQDYLSPINALHK